MLAQWKGDHLASGSGCRLNEGYYQPLCQETDVGPLHHYRWRGGVDNNSRSGNVYYVIYFIGTNRLNSKRMC